MGRETQAEVDGVMREAVHRLRARPELLTYVPPSSPSTRGDSTRLTRTPHSEALSTLSHTRQATLLSAFTTALTRGGPGGLPRPIELHAHDPLRYVGDMLAWVHQAIAAEREFLEGLFGVRAEARRRMVGAVRTRGGSEEEDWIAELMDAAVGGLCTPLKVSAFGMFIRRSLRLTACYRFAYNRQYARKRAASCRTRLRIFFSSTWLRCSVL